MSSYSSHLLAPSCMSESNMAWVSELIHRDISFFANDCRNIRKSVNISVMVISISNKYKPRFTVKELFNITM